MSNKSNKSATKAASVPETGAFEVVAGTLEQETERGGKEPTAQFVNIAKAEQQVEEEVSQNGVVLSVVTVPAVRPSAEA